MRLSLAVPSVPFFRMVQTWRNCWSARLFSESMANILQRILTIPYRGMGIFLYGRVFVKKKKAARAAKMNTPPLFLFSAFSVSLMPPY